MKFYAALCVCVVVAVAAAAKDVKDVKDAKEVKDDTTKDLKEIPRESRGLKESLSGISAALKGFNQFNSLMGAVNVTEIGDASTRVAKELSKSLKVDVFAVGKALAGAGAALGTTVFLGGMAALLATGLGFFNYSPRLYETGYPFTPDVYQNRVGPIYPGVLGQAQQAVYQRVQQAQAAYSGAQVAHGKGHLTGQAPVPVQHRTVSQTTQNRQTAQPQYPVYHGTGRGEFGEVSARTARVLDEVKQPSNPDLMPAIQDLISKLGEAVNLVGPQVMAAARR
ncbi:hypothetical protein BIW11_01578 [Tropilaelaps mercedesae]|uniref:Uncharacterized protein n=1 Tax=Tropilaelaps mercedesae TaxID=418985 RepID=A0A1V9XBY0_9ACAR|nr:hypothetical protein BIW11_01578 [Tropilaelaps mercedesae]